MRKGKRNSFFLGTGMTKIANRMRSQSRGRENSVSDASEVRGLNTLAFEPTYRMNPDESKQFPPCAVDKKIKSVLKSMLEDVTYDASMAPSLSVTVSNTLRMELKDLEIPRYKLICHVMLGEKKGQHVEVASRCLWNDNFDSYASATYQNNSLFAVGTVYGVYFE